MSETPSQLQSHHWKAVTSCRNTFSLVGLQQGLEQSTPVKCMWWAEHAVSDSKVLITHANKVKGRMASTHTFT